MTIVPPHASILVSVGISVISVFVILAWTALAALTADEATNRKDAATMLAAFSGYALFALGLAASGVLSDMTSRPPRFVVIPLSLVVLVVALARSRMGRAIAERAPLHVLVGLQGFRLALELVMHRAAEEGVMPPQMTFGAVHGALGFNYDIVTGVTAILLAFVLARRDVPVAVVAAWNALGSVLLLVIVTVAIVSTPVVAAFSTAPRALNTWIFYPPYVLLPAVLVGSALFGHVLVAMRLASLTRRRRAPVTASLQGRPLT